MDDFNPVHMIVPCTNLNINEILNLESTRDPYDKLQITFQAATEQETSCNLVAKTLLNTNLRSAETFASISNTSNLNVYTAPLIRHNHPPTIRSLETIAST